MRLPPLPPETLSPQLREVHDGIASLVTQRQSRIVIVDEQGALIGPFPAMLHFPQFGVPALMFQRALTAEARLSKTVREVAILTVGATYSARYELYAHEITAAQVGLSPSQVATLAAGGRPTNFERRGVNRSRRSTSVSFSGHILPTSTYDRATQLLGSEGVGELVFLIGGYCLIAMVLNCLDVPIPGAES